MDEKKRYVRLADEFESLISVDCPEEKVHKFLYENGSSMGCHNRVGKEMIQGFLSKFPVAPDRVPDLTTLDLYFRFSQYPNRVDLIELKRPSDPLFVEHGRMSKPLNDAWSECLDSIRILEHSFPDFIRRGIAAVNKIIKTERADSRDNRKYQHSALSGNGFTELTCRIFIGRRKMLSPEEIEKIHQIRKTNSSMRVFTYDLILDRLKDAAECGYWQS